MAAGSSSPEEGGLRGRVTTTVDLILLSASGRRLRLPLPLLPPLLLAATPVVTVTLLPPAPLLADTFLLLGDGDRLTGSLASCCLCRTLCLKSF